MQLDSAVREQLDRLGISAEALGAHLDGLSAPRLRALAERLDVQQFWAVPPVADNKYVGKVQDGRWNIPEAMSNLPPSASRALRGAHVRPTYHEASAALHASAGDLFEALMDPHTRRGVVLARGLHRDPELRDRFERRSALRVVNDGRADGAVSVVAPNAAESRSSSASGEGPRTFWDLFMQMDHAVMREAARLGGRLAPGSEGTTGLRPMGAHASSDGPPAGPAGGTSAGRDPVARGRAASGPREGAAAESSDPLEGQDERVLIIKRLVERLTQMYDLYRAVIDRYDSAARTAVGNLRG